MSLLTEISRRLFNTSSNHLDPLYQEYTNYIETAYPSNHTYKITNQTLVPKRELAARYKKIRPLFPQSLESLASVGCSKGFFIFSGSQFASGRCFGIDINPYDIDVCQWVKKQINNTSANFANLRLHEFANRIDEFGGPFQTVLVLNLYQYLFFGSDAFPNCYLDHDIIFENLRKICYQRVIFNNRVHFMDCQNTKLLKLAGEHYSQSYTEEKIRAAAAKYFTIVEHGAIGKYPLWTLEVR